MSRLKEINDEIYRRWKAGENHIDLASEFNRDQFGLRRLLKNRQIDEEREPYVPGRSNKERGLLNRERDEDIIAARTNGTATYEALGVKYGICRERVRQIWMRHLRRINDPRGWYGPRTWERMKKLQEENANH